MPPQLPTGRALAISAPWRPCVLARAFSGTPSVGDPPRDAPPQAARQQQPRSHGGPWSSSTGGLLSIGNGRNKNNNTNSNSNNTNSTGASDSGRPSSQRGDAASRLLGRYKGHAENALRAKQAQLELLRNQKNSNDYLKQMPRRWAAGDVYSPHDLSPVEMQKWRRRSKRTNDVVDALGIRPLDMYKVNE